MSKLTSMALMLVNKIDLTLLNKEELAEITFLKNIVNRFPGILLSVLSKVDLTTQATDVQNKALFVAEECAFILNPTENKVNK